MPNSWPSSATWSSAARTLANRLVPTRLERARHSADEFLQFCFTDATGRPLRQGAVHRDLQAFLTEQSRALVELPRDHGKSVQTCGRLLWELGRAPHLRVKLVCGTEAVALERAQFLRDAVAGNPRVRLVFPRLTPGDPWRAGAFSVAGRAGGIGPSVAAFGVGAGSTGARADLLVCDDIVDSRSLWSRADRRRVADEFTNNLLNMLEPGGRCWSLCTPWHRDDLNARLKAGGAFALFRRAVGPNLEPVWPEKWPPERLAERLNEIGAAAFARGYRLAPTADDEAAIRREWVRFWRHEEPRAGFDPVVLAIDPAVSVKATADASGLVVVGRRPGGAELRVLHAEGARLALPDLAERIGALDSVWSPDVILFETCGGFRGIFDLLARKARFGGRLRAEAPTRGKGERVAALALPFENGTLLLRGAETGPGAHPSQLALFEELTTFLHAPHDDLADALAAAVRHLLTRPDPRIWL